CQIVTEWITMKCFITEQSRPIEAAFLPSERQEFMKARSIPRGLAIYLGLCGEDSWASAYLRHSAQITRPSDPAPTDNRRNLQSISIGIADLFISMNHCQIDHIGIHTLLDKEQQLVRIHPLNQQSVYWPPSRMTWRQATNFANFQDKILKSNSVQWHPL